MAGGMGRGGVPLQARTRVGAEPPSLPSPATLGPARHCWVQAPIDAGAPRPGLLLQWRRTDEGGWEGLVVYAAQLRHGQWAAVQEWLAADLLSTA